MKKLTLPLFCLILILIPHSVLATSLALDFNDDSAEVRLDWPLTEDDFGQAIIGGRFLYNDDEDTKMGGVELKFMGDPGGVPGLKLGAGCIGYVGESHSNYDFYNLGVGLMADFAPPTLIGFGVAARIVYAPDIFSGRDSDGLFEFNTQVGYAITPKVKVYIGYQYIEGKGKGSRHDVDIDDDFRIGLLVHF